MKILKDCFFFQETPEQLIQRENSKNGPTFV